MSNKIQGPKVFFTLESYDRKEEISDKIARYGRLDRARKKMREIGHFSFAMGRYYTIDKKVLYIMKWENNGIGPLNTATYYI